ncbi:hypothetical protein B0H17DRAFT_1133215 [Mycena rosella]|uniref:Uncharacterized protein n=1 Tax=Mycena rosella TaxID=1033263 RepID=A0AAD7GKJ0_MYCRO|nr:hypothetical protein B0H17DRAFT_1133215 [Mycena rosella]
MKNVYWALPKCTVNNQIMSQGRIRGGVVSGQEDKMQGDNSIQIYQNSELWGQNQYWFLDSTYTGRIGIPDHEKAVGYMAVTDMSTFGISAASEIPRDLLFSLLYLSSSISRQSVGSSLVFLESNTSPTQLLCDLFGFWTTHAGTLPFELSGPHNGRQRTWKAKTTKISWFGALNDNDPLIHGNFQTRRVCRSSFRVRAQIVTLVGSPGEPDHQFSRITRVVALNETIRTTPKDRGWTKKELGPVTWWRNGRDGHSGLTK